MKHFFPLLLLFFYGGVSAQGNDQWGSYFSYSNIVDLAQSNSRVFAASGSAMFTQNVVSGELKTITSVDGLKADDITCLYYSPTYGRTLVGNSTGLLIVINANNSIVNRDGIVRETTVVGTKKKINHIYEYNGIAYLSCDFGIIEFNLETLEFGDTFYLGPDGSEIPVRQTTIYNGYIYAATFYGYGIRRGLLTNPNLNDYNQWEVLFNGYAWDGVVNFANQLFAVDITGAIIRLQGDERIPFASLPSAATDFRVSNGYLIATCANKVVVYNEQLSLVIQVNIIPDTDQTGTATYSCAAIQGQTLYIGTEQKGVFSVPLNFSSAFVNITPNGPLRNSIFQLEKSRSNLWAVFGSYDANYVPQLQKYGASKFTSTGWVNIPYSKLSVFGDVVSISDISVNPNNEKEVYLNSFGSGLLKLVDDVPVTLYNQVMPTNSLLQTEQTSGDPTYISVRVNGGTFDSAGNLWMANTRTVEPLKKLKPDGNWEKYSFEDIVEDPKLVEYGRMVIDRNGTKWMPTLNRGLVAFNEALNNKAIVINKEKGLEVDNVTCVEIDKSNRVWIGTSNGLRILYSADSFTTETTLEATNIVFLEDGVAVELMNEQSVTDIVTDGSNNKWIGTGGAGAFLVSPDGQSTLFHFTKENSPLPSNFINDIEIDDITGEVFFATDKGMVSYKGTSTAAEDDLSKVYVYPNPVRPGFEGDVKISGLINRATVKITDIEGNLVYETTSEGGTILWDTRAFGKYKVASGVYMIFISSEDASMTKVKKVMIVR